jgi:hypothetical protein
MKTKLIIALFALAIYGYNVNAQTNVSGAISSNTTWAFSGSPYNVISEVNVVSGVTLTIEPGVTVKFTDQLGLQIDGTLKAIGKSDSMIVFTTIDFIPNSGSWRKILFNPSSIPYNFLTQTGCIMQYCIVQYGGSDTYPVSHAIAISNASPYINHCIFRKNRGAMVISLVSQSIHVTDNIFLENEAANSGDVLSYSEGDNDSLFLNCNLFYKNENDVATFVGNSLISNNLFIENNEPNGLLLFLWKKTIFEKNQVIDNVTTNTSVISNYGVMNHNTITRNKIAGFFGTVKNCDSMSVFNYNNISGNIYNGIGHKYEYMNLVVRQQYNSPYMNAENNWWGTTIISDIDSLIYDYYDDTTECKVNYTPFLTSVDSIAPVTPVRNVVKENLGGGNVKITWAANPEADIAGYKIYWGNPTGYSFSNHLNVGNITSYTLTGFNFTDTIAVTAYDTQANDSLDQCQCHESWYTYDDYYYGNGISENSIQQTSILIYPNPSSGVFQIQLINDNKNQCKIEIFNVLGEKVYSAYYIQHLTFNEIDLKSQPNGIYFIRFTQDNITIATSKILLTE